MVLSFGRLSQILTTTFSPQLSLSFLIFLSIVCGSISIVLWAIQDPSTHCCWISSSCRCSPMFSARGRGWTSASSPWRRLTAPLHHLEALAGFFTRSVNSRRAYSDGAHPPHRCARRFSFARWKSWNSHTREDHVGLGGNLFKTHSTRWKFLFFFFPAFVY